MSKPFDRGDWVRLTTNALTNWRHALANEPPREPPEFLPAPSILRARAEYRHCVLTAWDHYRPDGPRDGEVLPNEVELLRKEQDAECILGKVGR